jgi:uncharacterized membrane protein (UPF0127 family)
VAAAGAVVLLLTGRVGTERILEGVDWTLLLFFSGLFIVMRGVEVSGLAAAMIERTGDLASASPVGKIAGIAAISVVLSNLVSNVPAVMLLKPLMVSLGNDRLLWLALAMSSTLAGNLTLIGSVANLIVAQQARRKVDIGFMEYFRVGALITVVTVVLGIAVLALQAGTAQGAERMKSTTAAVKVIPADGISAGRMFRVVLFCATEEARAQGLQGFRTLSPGEAALFVFSRPDPATFWMGSVSYPIDIIFVGADRKVVRVYRDCRPGSRELYPSLVPVQWVIETAAGSGIGTGDSVMFE